MEENVILRRYKELEYNSIYIKGIFKVSFLFLTSHFPLILLLYNWFVSPFMVLLMHSKKSIFPCDQSRVVMNIYLTLFHLSHIHTHPLSFLHVSSDLDFKPNSYSPPTSRCFECPIGLLECVLTKLCFESIGGKLLYFYDWK